MSECLSKLGRIREQAALYVVTTIYLFGIVINIVTIFFTFYFKRSRNRIMNQLHSGYITGNTMVFAVFLFAAVQHIQNRIAITCIQRKMLFVRYMFRNALSLSFLFALSKLQYRTLLSVHQIITAADRKRRRKDSFKLCAAAAFRSILLTIISAVSLIRIIIPFINAYHIVLNIVIFYFSYKCYKTPLGTNNELNTGNSVDCDILPKAKSDSNTLYNGVILTSTSRGLITLSLLGLALPLGTDFREIISWIGRGYIRPLILEAIIYILLISKMQGCRKRSAAPQ